MNSSMGFSKFSKVVRKCSMTNYCYHQVPLNRANEIFEKVIELWKIAIRYNRKIVIYIIWNLFFIPFDLLTCKDWRTDRWPDMIAGHLIVIFRGNDFFQHSYSQKSSLSWRLQMIFFVVAAKVVEKLKMLDNSSFFFFSHISEC